MNKKFVYQVGNNKKVVLFMLLERLKRATRILVLLVRVKPFINAGV